MDGGNIATLTPIDKKKSKILGPLTRRIYERLFLYEDADGNRPFKRFIYNDDFKKSNVYYVPKKNVPGKKFPVLMIYVKSVPIEKHGIENTELWKIQVHVRFFTLSYDEDDMTLHYNWIEEVDRRAVENPRLTDPDTGDNDLCVHQCKPIDVDFDWWFDEKGNYLVDESLIVLEVWIKKAAIKI